MDIELNGAEKMLIASALLTCWDMQPSADMFRTTRILNKLGKSDERVKRLLLREHGITATGRAIRWTELETAKEFWRRAARVEAQWKKKYGVEELADAD